MSSLVRYDAACRALAEAKSVDEVKDLRDKSEAMRAYAKQAKNRQLEVDAAEIRIRAERRLGEMIAGQKATVGLATGAAGIGQAASAVPSKYRTQPPTLAEAGIDKKLSARAQKMAAVPADEFESMVGEWRERVEAENERVTTNLLKAGEKRLSRDEREAELATRITALPDKKFGVILADPEWRFEPYSRDTGMDRAADNHYPTSALDEIKERPVWDISAKDCALFLWATSPMLLQALDVMQAWGFEYKSQVVWHKIRPGKGRGTGYWFTGEHEILLLGTRGNVPAPAPGSQFPSIFQAPVGEHSAKPDFAAEMIEAYFPNLPKIELNRRGAARPGWDAWGNEAETTESLANGPCEAGSERTADRSDPETGRSESRANPEESGTSGQDMTSAPDVDAGSRPDAGRSASATDDSMAVTARRDEQPNPDDDEPDMPEHLRVSRSWSDENLPSRRATEQ